MADVRPGPGEVQWRRSSYSAPGDCVEVGDLGESIHVRDSKNPDGPVIRVTRAEWREFVEAVKRGEFDRGQDGPRDRR